MRLSRRRRSGTPAMNMTPMIDIVFLLIIFFMTVSQVTKLNLEPLDLPKQDGSADQEASTVTINVTQDGDMLVSGNKVSTTKLVNMIKDIREQFGGDTNRLTVIVRADQRGTTTVPNEIVAAMTQLQLKRIRIAVQVPDPK